MATPGDQKCLLPTCSKSGQLNTFKQQVVNKLIECAVEHHDCEIRDKLQAVNKLIECAVERHDCEIVIIYRQ